MQNMKEKLKNETNRKTECVRINAQINRNQWQCSNDDILKVLFQTQWLFMRDSKRRDYE